MAVARHTERALARLGALPEAAPVFVAAEGVRFGGALLALPVILALGLLDAGEAVYGSLKKGFYGLRATPSTPTFMALLRVRSPEQLQGHPPAALGARRRSSAWQEQNDPSHLCGRQGARSPCR